MFSTSREAAAHKIRSQHFANRLDVLRRLKQLRTPLPQHHLDFVLIFFRYIIVEPRGNLPQDRFQSPLHAILGMQLQFRVRSARRFAAKMQQRAQRNAARYKRECSLAVLEKLAAG